MSFTLRVQFTGLCVHVIHPTLRQVAVLMPDARFVKQSPMKHPDDDDAIPHVAYLRADLANLAPQAGDVLGTDGTTRLDDAKAPDPIYEVIYRLENQTLDFGLPVTNETRAPGDFVVGVPDFSQVVKDPTLVPGLFTNPPTAPTLLFRTYIDGGTLTSERGDRFWRIDTPFISETAAPVDGFFSGEVTWTRQVDADDLTLTTTSFDGKSSSKLRLTPAPSATGPAIVLKVANLCAENPLEWNQFPIHSVKDDSDFKWLYTLFVPPPNEPSWQAALATIDRPMPAPRLLSKKFVDTGVDCIPTQITQAFTR